MTTVCMFIQGRFVNQFAVNMMLQYVYLYDDFFLFHFVRFALLTMLLFEIMATVSNDDFVSSK